MVKEAITIALIYYIYFTGKRKKSLFIINAGPKHLRKIHFNCLVLQQKTTNQPTKNHRKNPQNQHTHKQHSHLVHF